MMRLRTTVIELLSTFIQFSEDCFDSWMSDGRLRKGMEQLLAQRGHASQPASFWVLYWYKLWQNHAHNRAIAHLNAY